MDITNSKQVILTSIQFNRFAKTVFDSICEGLNPKVYIISPYANKDSRAFISQKDEHDKTLVCSLKRISSKLKLIPELVNFASICKELKKEIEDFNLAGNKNYFSIPYFNNIDSQLVVLKIDAGPLTRIPSLKSSPIPSDCENFKLFDSFIDAVASAFLEICYYLLPAPKNWETENRTDEVLASAAKNLLNNVICCGCSIPISLYKECNEIASMRYEGAEARAKILFSRIENSNLKLITKFQKVVPFTEVRKVRKLLELSGKDNFIVSDGKAIFGIGNLRKKSQIDRCVFEIHFIKHNHWELLHDGKVLMSVNMMKPGLKKERIKEATFLKRISEVFPKMKNKKKYFWELANMAADQKHGAMIVISPNAKEESARLKNRCFPVSPFQMKREFVHQATSIDGALLFAPDGKCHALGVILDGEAKESVGDSSRGSRYNSAETYYFSQKKTGFKPFILVISEDGMINIPPELAK